MAYPEVGPDSDGPGRSTVEASTRLSASVAGGGYDGTIPRIIDPLRALYYISQKNTQSHPPNTTNREKSDNRPSNILDTWLNALSSYSCRRMQCVHRRRGIRRSDTIVYFPMDYMSFRYFAIKKNIPPTESTAWPFRIP